MSEAGVTEEGAGRPTSDQWPLTDLERHVVHLSIKDDVSTIRAPGRPRPKWQVTPSGPRNRRLANPQLEALRRYAVRFRLTGGAPTPADEAAILAAGYDEAQVESVEELVRLLQPDLLARQPSYARAGLALVLAALVLGLCIWLGQAFENAVIALIVLGLLAVTVASFFTRGS